VITCSHFGPSRKVQFPGYFFCSNCDWWDQESKIGNKQIKQNSQKCVCKAGHSSWVYPTRKQYNQEREAVMTRKEYEEVSSTEEEEEDEDSDDDDTNDEDITETIILRETQIVLVQKIEDVTKRLRSAQAEARRLEAVASSHKQNRRKTLLPTSNDSLFC
jgi:hypothetical protein